MQLARSSMVVSVGVTLEHQSFDHARKRPDPGLEFVGITEMRASGNLEDPSNKFPT